MTDENRTGGDAAVKPQVIDLEAEDVTVERDPPPEEPLLPPKPKARRRVGGTLKWAAAALLIGLVAGGWIYRDLLSTYLPSSQMTAMQDRIGALEVNNKSLNDQIAAANEQSKSADSATAALDDGIKNLSSGISGTQSRISAIESRIAQSDKALQAAKADLDQLRSAVSSGGASTGNGAADPAALAAIGQRIDALEKDVASLKSSGGGSEASSTTAALSQALSDLKAKAAAGTSFKDEYERIARMVPAAAGLDVLAAHAEAGLPDAAGLAAELRAAIPTLPQPKTETPAASGSYWDSIWGTLSSIITIRDIGDTDWPTLAEKCAALAEAGDVTQAIALIDATEGDKPAALNQWRDRAAQRLKLEAALDQVAQAVLRQISALGGAQ